MLCDDDDDDDDNDREWWRCFRVSGGLSAFSPGPGKGLGREPIGQGPIGRFAPGSELAGSEKARYRTYRLAYIIEFTMADADILFIRREATEVTSLSITPRTHGRRVVPPFAGPTLHNLL